MELSWDYVEGDAAYSLHKYKLLTDNDFENDVNCPVLSCSYEVDYLRACKEHEFLLTPYFYDPSGGSDLIGDTVSTIGFTEEKRK